MELNLFKLPCSLVFYCTFANLNKMFSYNMYTPLSLVIEAYTYIIYIARAKMEINDTFLEVYIPFGMQYKIKSVSCRIELFLKLNTSSKHYNNVLINHTIIQLTSMI